MKKLFLISTTVLMSLVANGQNLVPNYSFENYTSCPTATAQFNLATPWDMPANTGGATTDFYNECNTTGTADVPLNVGGYQSAKTGIGYAGLYTYGAGVREYMQVQLSSSLIAGAV